MSQRPDRQRLITLVAFVTLSAVASAQPLPPPLSTLASQLSLEERQALRRDIERWSNSVKPERSQFDARRDELRALARERFREADLNDDNCLDPREIEQLNPRLLKHFPNLDRDGDGLVGFDEFLEAINDRNRHVRDQAR